MNPRRAWIAIFALALGILVAVWALSTYLEGRRATPEHRFLDVWKIDAHQHAGPGALSLALKLALTQRIRGFVNYQGGHVGGGLEEQIAAAARFPGRVAVFMDLDLEGCCGVAWSNREVVRMVQGRAGGARGLAISQALGLTVRDRAGHRVPLDAPELEPIWDMAWRLEIPVAVGVGGADVSTADPDAGRAGGEPWRVPFEEFVRVVERHPLLSFIGAHFGNDAANPAEIATLLDRLSNLYVDTAASLEGLGQHAEATRAAILAHPDRVLFGTDLKWLDGPKPDEKAVVLGAGRPAHSLSEIRRFFESTWRFYESRDGAIPSPGGVPSTLQGLGLPRPVLEKLYHGNAERLLGFGRPEID